MLSCACRADGLVVRRLLLWSLDIEYGPRQLRSRWLGERNDQNGELGDRCADRTEPEEPAPFAAEKGFPLSGG
ncbi:MAG: hypothetical protein ACRENI_00695 [Gemmatimonadaceae bacterium]